MDPLALKFSIFVFSSLRSRVEESLTLIRNLSK